MDEVKDKLLKAEVDLSDALVQLREKEAELQTLRREMQALQRQTEAAIERANELALEAQISSLELKQIFNTLADPTWVVDREFNVRRINEPFVRLLGRESSEVVGRKCYEVFKSELCQTSDCPMQRLTRGADRAEFEIEMDVPGGRRIPFILAATPFSLMDDKPIGIVEAYKDISERKQAEQALRALNEELKRLALIDGLTQVANRRSFEETLKKEWKRLQRARLPLSLVILDVDFFKLYNDTYGHQMGDECLKAVAWFVGLQARRSSDLVARYGGEEFAVLLPDTSLEGALEIAEKIRAEISGLQLEHNGSPIDSFVSVSLGVSSLVPSPNSSPELLVSLADKALYEAKQAGRNQVKVRTSQAA